MDTHLITQPTASAPPVDARLPADIEAHVARLREIDRQVATLARWMDVYMIDGIGGLVPGVGDLATSAVKVWLFFRAKEAGVPAGGLWKIVGWAFLDLTVGLIPGVGDLLDFVIRSNLQASRLVHAHIEERLQLIEAARRQAAGITEVPAEHAAYRELRSSLSLAA